VGISDTPAWIVAQANTLAELRGWSRFVGLQTQYSLVERTAERELLPMARALDLAVTPWGVLGSGVLSGKYNANKDEKGRAALRGPIPEKRLHVAAAVVEIGQQIGRTPSQVALAWLRQQRGVIVPILGAKNAAQLRDNLGCLDLRLDDAAMKTLSDASAIELGFPHDFLASDAAKDLLFGGTFGSIDNHRA